MKEQFAIVLFVLLSNVHWGPLRLLPQLYTSTFLSSDHHCSHNHLPDAILLAETKGVAGLGKAGGEGQGGADKAGQQVPPEVYMALTYAGTLFLFTLSVPLILYGLNKLLNKIEDCFGCGPSSQSKTNKTTPVISRKIEQQEDSSKPQSNGTKQLNSTSSRFSGFKMVNNGNQHQTTNGTTNSGSLDQHQYQQNLGGGENITKQYQQNQRLHLQMLREYPKYTQFISMSSPDYDPTNATSTVHVNHSSPPPPLAPGKTYPRQPPLSGGSPTSRTTINSHAPHNNSPNLYPMTKN